MNKNVPISYLVLLLRLLGDPLVNLKVNPFEGCGVERHGHAVSGVLGLRHGERGAYLFPPQEPELVGQGAG